MPTVEGEDAPERAEGRDAAVARRTHFSLPPPAPMNLKSGNLADNWTDFEEEWSNWATATKLNSEEPAVIVAALKHTMGRETLDIFRNLHIENAGSAQAVLEALRGHFMPKKNVTYERYVFNTTVQNNETIDMYANKLRRLAASCEFGALKESVIRDRIVMGVTDDATRERLLREDDPNLETCLKICRAAERTQQQMKAMTSSNTAEPVHRVGKQTQSRKSGSIEYDCEYCGTRHKKRKCPAYGKQCSKCNKMNHFPNVCRSSYEEKPKKTLFSKKKASDSNQKFEDQKGRFPRSGQDRWSHQLEAGGSDLEEEYDDEAEIFIVSDKAYTKYMVRPEMKIPNGSVWAEMDMQIDNGSEVNCLRKQDLYKLNGFDATMLQKTGTKLRAYGGVTLHPVGKIDLKIKINDKERQATFLIVEEATTSLLSGKLSEELGLISVNRDLLVNQVTQQLTKEQILLEYKDVFEGLGHIGYYHIELREDAKPSQDAPRTVPVAMREELKQRLKEMEAAGILAKVSQPTDWVSSAVYVKKPNKQIRICLDPQALNRFVRIPKFRMPTLDDITPQLSNVRVFSVCDAKDGFLQIELDEQSSLLTTFHTPFGRYRWQRLPFGICSAPEEFQRRVLEIIDGLSGVYAIADDCIIVGQGATIEEAIADHDRAFLQFLDRCRQRNFKLNISKLKFRLDSVKYHGHMLTSEGLLPDPEKVEAITKLPRPKDKAETRRLLGMVTYLAKFVPQLSEVTQPLRDLTKQDVQFLWSPYHDQVLEKLKQLLSSSPCLKYYDVNDDCVLETDASEYGLGAVILQQGRPVAYASRTLSETERRYSQLEKECLALMYGCVRFDQYLLGKENVTAFTDHQPLETILRKPINSATKRVQRMMLRLQRYKLNVVYKKGTQMHISDHLSRSPIPRKSVKTSDAEIFSVEQLMTEIEDIDCDMYHNVGDITMDKIRVATETDATLQLLAAQITRGFPSDKNQMDPEIRHYWPYRDELSVENGVVYRGVRVIVPAARRQDMLLKLHASHLGIEATLRKARDSLYWPSLHHDITNMCQSCQSCQQYQAKNCKEPMQSQPVPTKRWQVCATDLFAAPDGTEYVVVVDSLTKFWEFEPLPELTAETVITKIKSVFARHGVPEVVISDNGPQYACEAFKKFAVSWGFIHYTSSPHHPSGNGVAEAAVKVIKNILKKADDVYMAVLEHRNTPDLNGYSSSQKLNSRSLRTTLPAHGSKSQSRIVPIQEIMTAQVHAKCKNKFYYDRSTKTLPRLAVGDNIRAKLTPNAEWSPGTVKAKLNDRSYIIQGTNNRDYRRNRVHLRDSLQPAPEPLPQRCNSPPASETPSTPAPVVNSSPVRSRLVTTPVKDKPPERQVHTPEAASTVFTRTGRMIRRPSHLIDFQE